MTRTFPDVLANGMAQHTIRGTARPLVAMMQGVKNKGGRIELRDKIDGAL
jgi:hypothetical protein